MPYIKPEERHNMDIVVETMKRQNVEPDGRLNYVLYKLCKDSVEPSYNNLKNYCAELRQCATEIERRILAEYEDLKCSENGDVE